MGIWSTSATLGGSPAAATTVVACAVGMATISSWLLSTQQRPGLSPARFETQSPAPGPRVVQCVEVGLWRRRRPNRESRYAAAAPPPMPITETVAAGGRFGSRHARVLTARTEPDGKFSVSDSAKALVGPILRSVLDDLPNPAREARSDPLWQPSAADRIGVQRVLAREIELAVVCGGTRPRDLERGMRSYVLGYHVAVVAVAETNPLRSLTGESMRRMLTASKPDWREFGGGHGPVDRRSANDTDLAWMARILIPGDRIKSEGRASLAALPTSARTIAICSLAALGRADPCGLRPLSIDAVAPSFATARNGQYPASRPVQLVWHQDRARLAQAVVAELKRDAVVRRLARVLTLAGSPSLKTRHRRR